MFKLLIEKKKDILIDNSMKTLIKVNDDLDSEGDN